MRSKRVHWLSVPSICGLTALCCCLPITGQAHAGSSKKMPTGIGRVPRFRDAQDLLLGGGHFAPCLAVAVGDLSGNGFPDFVVATTVGIEMFLNEHTPEGNVFRRQDHDLLTGPTWIQDVVIADLTGDGLPDILAAALHRIFLFQNMGNADFVDCTNLAGSDLGWVNRAQNLRLVDLDADQDLDLLIARFNFGDDQALLNDGQGNFSDQYSLPLLAYTPTYMPHQTLSFHTGDMDGDGDPDLLALRHAGHPGFYIQNSGGYTFQLETHSMIPFMESDRMRSAALADFDGNGSLDIYLCVEEGYGDRLYCRLEHSPVFNHIQPLSPIGYNLLFSSACTAEDFNEDGLPDVVSFSTIKSMLTGQMIQRTVLQINTHFDRDDVPSFFALLLPRAGPTHYTNVQVTDIATLDLNQDGRPDLLQSVDSSGAGAIGGGTGGVALLLHSGYYD